MSCGGPQDLARREGHGVRLQDQVHDLWPTAVVQDSKSAARHTTKTDVMHPGTMLLDAVRQWPTPSTQRQVTSAQGAPGEGFQDAARLGSAVLDAVRAWPTPNATDTKGPSTRSPGRERGPGDDDLPTRVDRVWPTPRATEGEKGGPEGRDGSGSEHLCATAVAWADRIWPTPAVADTEGGRASRSGARSDELLLNGLAAAWADYPTPSATEYGSSQNGINGKGGEFERPSAGTASLSTRARRGELAAPPGVLNPVFVEALMGWPLNWTSVEEPAGFPAPFPPRPNDREGWSVYLALYPDAIPAVQKDAQPENRVDRLRACGNGVVPAQAEAAFGELFGALGFAASTDQGSESRTESPRTRGWRNAWRTAQVNRG